MGSKPKVFVITPFNEDFLALYDELKRIFKEDFDFTNAGDLDNQQNILQDIVEGIHQADVIIADLTGLNANVFYELGLAHAMNKKVIIITQDLGELPFDIKSYRANEYSLQFNKLHKLIEELKKLLFGAIDNSVKYGILFQIIYLISTNVRIVFLLLITRKIWLMKAMVVFKVQLMMKVKKVFLIILQILKKTQEK